MNPIEKTRGPCVILAGAGTGKTHTIVEKIKYLIKNKVYSPERIVCITFSNEAANNLMFRVRKALEFEDGKEPVIRTFHAFSADLLRNYGDLIGINNKFSILDPDEAKVVLHRHLKIIPNYCYKYIGSIGTAKDLGIGIEEIENYLSNKMKKFLGIDLEKRLENLQFEMQTLHLSNFKVQKKDIFEEIKRIRGLLDLKKFVNAWKGYEKLKTLKNYQDYSDLNLNALKLLREKPEVAGKFDYIIVDEFQDTNKVQLDLLTALAPHRNITVVGDLNQSIYRFRGAYKENFSLFKKAFGVEDKEVFNLDKSYRSTNKILKAAHALVRNNYENKEECFQVWNSHGIEGQEIEVYELKNGREEARKAVEIIEREIERGERMEDICIMFRTHQQGRIIKRMLDFKGIPYFSVARSSLLKEKSVKTVIDYITILNKLCKKEKGGEQAWWDLMYQLDFIDEDLIRIGKFMKENKDAENISALLLSSLDKLPLSTSGRLASKILSEKIKKLIPICNKEVCDILTELYSTAGLLNYEETKEEKEVMLNLSSFYDLAKNHSSLYESDLSSFIHYLDILESLGIEIEASQLEEKGVRLMTSHSTKGLEYKTVIITNLAQNRFPLTRISVNSLVPLELNPELKGLDLSEDDLEYYVNEYERRNQLFEERRLCYVSFTRAKEKLILTYAGDYGGKKHFPSQFLNEINYLENEDFIFKKDLEEKDIEFENATPLLKFNSVLNSRNFDDLLVSIVKQSERGELKFSSDKVVFSPSALLLFDSCQKRYEYKYVYNMPDEKVVSWEAIRMGSFVHLVLEKGVKENFKEMKEFFDYSKELKTEEEWDSVDLQEAERLVRIFFERNKNKYNENSRTEQRLDSEIAGMKFIGFADRIDFNSDGLEIVDYKTGVSQLMPKNRNWQLGYYALAASKFGKVKKITLEMLKHDKPLEFELDDRGNAKSVNGTMEFNIYEVEEQLIKTAHAIKEAFENGFKACNVERNCDFCSEYVYGI